MGIDHPGKRNGTGPARRSYQRKTSGGKGRRQQRGEPCPKKK